MSLCSSLEYIDRTLERNGGTMEVSSGRNSSHPLPYNMSLAELSKAKPII